MTLRKLDYSGPKFKYLRMLNLEDYTNIKSVQIVDYNCKLEHDDCIQYWQELAKIQ